MRKQKAPKPDAAPKAEAPKLNPRDRAQQAFSAAEQFLIGLRGRTVSFVEFQRGAGTVFELVDSIAAADAAFEIHAAPLAVASVSGVSLVGPEGERQFIADNNSAYLSAVRDLLGVARDRLSRYAEAERDAEANRVGQEAPNA